MPMVRGKSSGWVIALTGICAGLAPGAVQAQETKFLIGIVELQLTNPFFGRLKKSAVDTAKKNGLDVKTAEANTAVWMHPAGEWVEW